MVVRGGVLVFVCAAAFTLMACDLGTGGPGDKGTVGPDGWRLVHHETFDAPFGEPAHWTEDTYGAGSPYHVDAFDDDGEFFFDKDPGFGTALAQFRSFRKSFAYGEGGWLTVELYGRDADRDGAPESGGRFVAMDGRARLETARHTDGAIIRPTQPLPARYRVEVTVSNIQFGGKVPGGGWSAGGKTNGLDGDEKADPWRKGVAATENGVRFLTIVDHARAAPRNNVFMQYHRKMTIDVANNVEEWSSVWNPGTGKPEKEGSRGVGMYFSNGEAFEPAEVHGTKTVSYTPGGWQTEPVRVDQYLDGETYVFSIERDGEAYTLSASGRFRFGGATTYTAKRRFRDSPIIWHYNQTAEEYGPPHYNQKRTYQGQTLDTWPAGSAYPDVFMIGDPFINFYEGTADYDDLKLYLPGG